MPTTAIKCNKTLGRPEFWLWHRKSTTNPQQVEMLYNKSTTSPQQVHNKSTTNRISGVWPLCVTVSPKRCETGPQLLLATYRKSHKGFSLATKSMTMDGLEQPITAIRVISTTWRIYNARLPDWVSNVHILCPWSPDRLCISKPGSVPQAYAVGV